MTAEIVVANKWGIAMAADSAVTSSYVYKGEVREKVYQAANKLFTLSKWEPVSAMIYNSVTLGGTPWETIIKLARQKLGRDGFDTLDQYADFFWRFLDEHPHVVPADDSRYIAGLNILRLLDVLETDQPSPADFRARLDRRIADLEKTERLDAFDDALERSVPTYYAAEIDAGLEWLEPPYRAGNKTRVRRLVQLTFTRKERLRGYSGLVLAGFGRAEVMPRIIDYWSDIMVCGRPRFWRNEDRRVSVRQGSLVLPFADTGVIDTLLNGINPSFHGKQNNAAIQAIFAIANRVIDEISEIDEVRKEEYKTAAVNAIVDAFREFAREMDAYRRDEVRNPIERTLESLPVSDLAVVAETLLNASQIHKRVNPDTETVGGPVDVAVLTKGDGFVWIKRKHYFNKDLNPAFVGKYLDC